MENRPATGPAISPESRPNPEFELALRLVETTSRNVFLTGRAGTGKTTFLREVRRRAAKQTVVLAPTGIAAINAGGSTLHSFFLLPFGLFLPGYRRKNKFRIGKEKIDLMRSADLLVIDEVSMLRADILDEVSGILQHYRGNSQPFGGVQLLLIGDLQQLSPIVKDEEWREMQAFYPSPYFFESRALQEAGFCTVELKTIYRQVDADFIGLLEKIRLGTLDAPALGLLSSRYRPSFVPPENEGYITLTTHNFQAEAINEKNLNALSSRKKKYEAEITGNFPESSFPTGQSLAFKTGAQVMFVKNDASPEKRYYNGKIGRIRKCLADKVIVESEGEIVEVGKAVWENVRYEVDEKTREIKEVSEGSFTQIPLKLAWAITIHKSQGLTFDKVVIDAGRAFAHGQVYVALSRCRTLQGVVLRSPLTQDALVPDRRIEAFGQEERYRAREEDLPYLQADYTFRMLCRKFNFKTLQELLQALRTFSEKNFKSYPRLAGDIADSVASFEKEIFEVSLKFERELHRLRSATPEHQAERRCKAAVYFSDKMESDVMPLLPRLGVELDSKMQEKKLASLRTALKREAVDKQAALLQLVNQRETFGTPGA